MKISVQSNLEPVRRQLGALRDQVPFATALALTKTAQAAQVSVRQEMVRVFDRPTPFTLASTFVRSATKAKLEAAVYLKTGGNKEGGNAQDRLGHQVLGGQRRFKRMEGALRQAGMLGNGEQAVPGRAAELDSYGNMSRGQITQILAWFQAFPEAGYKANSTQATRAKRAAGKAGKKYGTRFYYKRDRPGRGIYKATQTGFGSAIQPVLMFVRRATYRQLLDMPGVVERTAREQFPAWFRDALQSAMRTAR
jgi:hypothetical protein